MTYSPFEGIDKPDEGDFEGPDFFDFGRQHLRIKMFWLEKAKHKNQWWLKLDAEVVALEPNEWTADDVKVGMVGRFIADLTVKWKVKRLAYLHEEKGMGLILAILACMRESGKRPKLEGKTDLQLQKLIKPHLSERLCDKSQPTKGLLIQLNKIKEYGKDENDGPYRREYWSVPTPLGDAPSESSPASEPAPAHDDDDIPF